MMKATHDVKTTMPENGDKFTDPFFSRFSLRHAAKPLQLTDAVSKNYKFPTLYNDVTCAIGIFMCDYEAARKALPDPRLKPVRMTKGRALVAFSCYEYKNVMGVFPYNEVSMMIPVLFDAPVDLPVLPMLAGSKYPGFGYYVFHMPVTSKENQIRGNKIWGLPKVTQDIDVRTEGGDCITTCFESDGTPYFELKVPTAGSPAHFDVGADVVSQLDHRWLLSRTSFKSLSTCVPPDTCRFKKP